MYSWQRSDIHWVRQTVMRAAARMDALQAAGVFKHEAKNRMMVCSS
jgi:hypothetical protein